MTRPQLVATAWTSAGDTSPMRVPATSPVPIAERVAAVADAGFTGLGFIADDLLADPRHHRFRRIATFDLRPRTHPRRDRTARAVVGTSRRSRETPTTFASCCSTRPTYLAPAFIKIGSELGPRHCLSRAAGRTVARTRRRRQPNTALASPSRRCRSRSSRPYRWEPKSSLQPLILRIGLLLDAWHVFRAGTSLDELRAALTPEMIFGVELDDAAPGCGRNALRRHREPSIAVRRRLFRPSRLGGSPARQGLRRAVGRGDPVVRRSDGFR